MREGATSHRLSDRHRSRSRQGNLYKRHGSMLTLNKEYIDMDGEQSQSALRRRASLQRLVLRPQSTLRQLDLPAYADADPPRRVQRIHIDQIDSHRLLNKVDEGASSSLSQTKV